MHEDKSENPTIVKFGLWPILALIITALGYLYLANSQACDRITKLETKFDYIATGVSEIKDGIKDVAEALRQHETRSRP